MQLNNDHGYQQESSQGSATQARMDQVYTKIDPNYAMPGKVFFLPAKAELPAGAVTRGYKRGRIGDGVYNHPVVVVSHPYDDENFVHFFLITSFQGRRLEELYYDPDNATHKYRRKWYLPIAPTPNHPDAISKLTRKRFPTLVLGRGATLRTNSYVNIRHIYRIRHSLLQTYTNPVTPDVEQYRLKGESKIRMIAKCKTLTNYEPTRQFGSLPKPKSEPSAVSMSVSRPASTDVDEGEEDDYEEDDNGDDEDDDADARPLVVCAMASLDITTNTMTTARESTATSDRAQADFRLLNTGTERKADVRPKIPPDIERTRGRWVPQDVSVRQVGQFLGEVESLAILAHQRLVTMSYDPTVIRRPLDRAWRDFKGVTAVAIASM